MAKKFTYTAVNKEEKTVSGDIEALSKEKAMEMLTKQGLRPILLRPQKTGFDPNNLSLGSLGAGRVKNKDLVIFTRQLSTMVNAGVPLVRGLVTLQTQTASKKLKSVLGEVVKDVESGAPLADSLEKHPETFSPVFYNMVRAGEAGGILDSILKKLAMQEEKDSTMRKKIKSAMTYPAVLIVVTVVAFFVLTLFILPKIGKIITDLAGEDADLPIYTEIMLGFSKFMVNFWYIILVIIIGLVFFLARSIKTPKGRYVFDSLMLKIPVVKTVVLKVSIARFARTFASLMSSGVSVLEALNVTSKALGNKVIEAELMSAAKAVRSGKQLSEPLSNSKIFPPIVAQMLAVGEETGKTDEVLVKVADFYEEEVDTLIDGLSAIIEPIMIVIIGGTVGLIAASVIGPISSLSQQIK